MHFLAHIMYDLVCLCVPCIVKIYKQRLCKLKNYLSDVCYEVVYFNLDIFEPRLDYLILRDKLLKAVLDTWIPNHKVYVIKMGYDNASTFETLQVEEM